MKNHFYIFLLSLFISSHCVGQDPYLDSLSYALKTSDDTTKVNVLHSLFLEYEFSDSEKGKEYLNQALDLSQKNNYTLGLGRTHLFLGYYSEDKSNYQDALIHYSECLELFEKIKYQNGVAAANNNLGSVYQALGNYPQALLNHLVSLRIREQLGDKKGEADSYNNIGVVYYFQGNFKEALKNYSACLEIEKQLGSKKGIAVAYNNIAGINLDQGNYEEALKNHFKSLKLKEEIGDKRGISAAYNNIGNVYSDQAEQEKNLDAQKSLFEKALKYFFASIDIKEVSEDKTDLATSFINVADVYLKQKKYADAKTYFIKAKVLGKEIGYKECLKIAYDGLSEIDSANADYKGAYENHKLYILYRDSLDNEETRKKTIQSQMTYDFEKKEAVATAEHKKELENQEILSEEKSRKQKIVLALVSCFLLLVVIFAGFIFKSLRTTRKQKTLIEQQKNIVEEQKQEVELQKLLVEEKQKEIIDSINYAKRIQRSQLPTEKYIEKNLKRLMKK